MANRTCSIDGCERAHYCRGWCDLHYRRWRVHGDPTIALRRTVRKPRGRLCSLDECGRPHYQRGLCAMHHARWKRHGDPRRQRPRWRAGEGNGMWKGDAASYEAIHIRLQQRRGPASGQRCLFCWLSGVARPALHWAYDNTDPDELVDGKGRHYSTNPSRYLPLCAPCHKRFDNADAIRRKEVE